MGVAKRLALSLLVLGPLLFASYGKAPAEPSRHHDETEDFNPALWFVNLYREHVSPIDGDRCPSFPTCSTYSLQAIRKHGLVLGWMMTVDRLIHEGEEEKKVSPVVYADGRWKIFDPVQNNDFWWHHPASRHEE